MLPYAEHREEVRPEWTDARGELSPAFAVVIFDHAVDLVYEGIGIGESYRRETSFSSFTLETHALFEGTVRAGETVLVRNHVLAVDTKRLHVAQEMFRPGQTWRVAMIEQLSIHVDLSIRRSAPFPPERLGRIRDAIAAQAGWPCPVGIGHRVGLDHASFPYQDAEME